MSIDSVLKFGPEGTDQTLHSCLKMQLSLSTTKVTTFAFVKEKSFPFW